jgi:phosphoribosyl 1,2-cyclic phosphodiesterase
MDTMLDLPVIGKFYGVRGSFPSNHYNAGHTTCHTIQFGDTLIIFDFGSGMLDLGNELAETYLTPGKTVKDLDLFMKRFISSGNDLKGLEKALLNSGIINQAKELKLVFMSSHVHGDHLFGAQAFKPIFNKQTHIHMIGGMHNDLNLEQVMEQFVFRPPVFPVPYQYLGSQRTMQVIQPDEHFTIPCSIGGDIRVWMLQMNHPNQSYGYRFEWGGKVIAVTLDHEHGKDEYDKNIVRLWAGADIVVTEVQYDDAMYQSRIGFGHITATAAAKHASDAKPKKIITTHHDPDADEDIVQEIARTIERLSGVRTEHAWQGKRF